MVDPHAQAKLFVGSHECVGAVNAILLRRPGHCFRLKRRLSVIPSAQVLPENTAMNGDGSGDCRVAGK